MKKTIIIIVVLILLAVLLIGPFWLRNYMIKQFQATHSFKPPPVTVATAVAKMLPWSTQINAVGSVTAVQSTQITAQIAGNVTAIYFNSGDEIDAGQKIVTVDDTTQLAQLHVDQAALSLAKINLARDQKLLQYKAVSQAQIDTDQANVQSSQAVVEVDHSNLNKLDIKAPFSGHLGIRQVSLGQYLSTGTAIVTLTQWKPIYVDFSIPQVDLPQVNVGQQVSVGVDAYPDKTFTGTITALESEVDPTSRNIQVQATFDNADEALKPGMFCDTTVAVGTAKQVLTVPAIAIDYNTFGDNVYVVVPVNPDEKSSPLTVKQVVVTTGEQRDGTIMVESGLKAGDIVVEQGQLKLYPGAMVVVDNSIQP
jgi:membrane fusion protein, multidrug efflux system